MADVTTTEIIIAARDMASAELQKVAVEMRALSAEAINVGSSSAAIKGGTTQAAESVANLEANTAKAEKSLAGAKNGLEDVTNAGFKASPVVKEVGSQAGISAGLLGLGPLGLATAAGVAAAILGGAAIKSAADFQQQLTKLTTSAGESASNLGLVSDGIKNIAIQTGASVTDLADGMYKVSSAGFHGAQGLDVLKASEQGARAEGANLETVADAVSSALIDYHLKASDAADVTSKLVAATASGKMRFEELAGAMPAILPVASAAHVALSDVLGDLASMTVHGMSAEQAAQNLSDAIRHMQNPTAQQAKELALLGLTTTQLADDMQQHGLSGTLQEISTRIANLMPQGSDKVILDLKTALQGLSPQVQALGLQLFNGSMTMKDYAKAAMSLDPISAKQATSFATLAGATHRIGDQQMSGAQVMQNYGQALAKATGDATGLNVALMLTGENANTTNNAIKAVSSASADAAGNVKGWSDIQKNFNQQMDQFTQTLRVGLMSAGEWLIGVWNAAQKYLEPVFAVIKKAWDDYLMPVFNWISGDGGKKSVEFFGTVLAGAILAVVIPLVVLGAEFMIVIAVLNRVISVISSVVSWLGDNIPKAVQGVVKWWQKLVSDTQKNWQDFVNSIKKAWDDSVKAVIDGVNAVADWFAKLPGRIAFSIGYIAGVLVHFATVDVPNFIATTIKWFEELPAQIGKAVSDMWNTVVKWFGDTENSMTQFAQTSTINVVAEIGKLPGQVGELIKGMWNNVVSFFNDFANNVKNWAKDTVKGVMDEFTKLPGQIGDAVKNAWNGASSTVSSGWNGLVNQLTQGFQAGLNHHALGTNFAPGGLTMVGENGPELVSMPTGSKVFNAKETSQMVGSGNKGVTINGGLHIHNNIDEQRVLAKIGMGLALA